MIFSSVNPDRFILPSFYWGGISLLVEEFQGFTSPGAVDGRNTYSVPSN
jgi:hypothetical protein